MTQTTKHIGYTLPRLWYYTGLAGVAATVLVGLAYAWKQWHRGAVQDAPHTVVDGALIILVCINAIVVYRFGFHVAPKLGQMIANFPSTSADPQQALNAMLGHPLALPFGVLYGAMIGGGAWHMNPWPESPDLQDWLAAFIFTGNVFIGFAIFAVIRFWQLVLHEIPDLDVRILNLSRPPILPLLRVNSQIVMITAFVASSSILSVVLAGYEEEPLIIAFSLFALFLVVSTYAVPVLPLSNRLRADKAEELDRIERLIEAHVRRLTANTPRNDGPGQDAKLPELETLVNARDLIAGIGTMPPGGQVSVSAAGIVAFLSFMPTIVDYIIDKM